MTAFMLKIAGNKTEQNSRQKDHFSDRLIVLQMEGFYVEKVY